MQKKRNQENFLPHIGIDLMGSDTDSCFIIDSLLPILDSLQKKCPLCPVWRRKAF